MALRRACSSAASPASFRSSWSRAATARRHRRRRPTCWCGSITASIEGQQQVEVDPFGRYSNFGRYRLALRQPAIYRGGFYDPRFGIYYGRPYYSRYGYRGVRSPYYYGWDDPYWYRRGGLYGDDIRAYTVFNSFLDLNIVRRADNAPLFEGKAQARSQTDELGTLVPNLVDAMFTGFPGRNGETVRITVPARRR